MRVALAVTAHDPGGHLAPGVERTASAFERLFRSLVANVTEPTSEALVSALGAAGASVMTHAVGNVAGRSRRNAVALALDSGADRILYSDLDHAIRWIEHDPEELEAVVMRPDMEDFVIVGRNDEAFQRSPARLRKTESVVNHVYRLATGRSADLMFGIRLLSRPAAKAVVAGCTEATMASDVEWPMFAEHAGYTVGYVAAAGLDYRTTADFDLDADAHDRDPDAWIHRVELAAHHLTVLRRMLPRGA